MAGNPMLAKLREVCSRGEPVAAIQECCICGALLTERTGYVYGACDECARKAIRTAEHKALRKATRNATKGV